MKMQFTILPIVRSNKVNTVLGSQINHFNEKLVMTKEDDEDFENYTKYRICDSDYVDGDVILRYHYHIAGKFLSYFTA